MFLFCVDLHVLGGQPLSLDLSSVAVWVDHIQTKHKGIQKAFKSEVELQSLFDSVLNLHYRKQQSAYYIFWKIHL